MEEFAHVLEGGQLCALPVLDVGDEKEAIEGHRGSGGSTAVPGRTAHAASRSSANHKKGRRDVQTPRGERAEADDKCNSADDSGALCARNASASA
jgi:hypothetical protein